PPRFGVRRCGGAEVRGSRFGFAFGFEVRVRVRGKFCDIRALSGKHFLRRNPSRSPQVVDSGCGTSSAIWWSMGGAKRVEDLEAYKLAVQVRRRIFQLTKRMPVASDFKFVGQIRDAARGGSRNISEGFSRFAPNEFRVYLSYARS